MDISDHVASILRMFEIEPAPLDRLVDYYFKKHRNLGSRERRSVARAAFGVARWRLRLDCLLAGKGISKPAHLDRARMFLEMGDRVADLPREEFSGSDAAYHSFPEFLYGMLVDQYGVEGAGRLARALNREQLPQLRINSLVIGRDEARRCLAEAGIESAETSRSPYGLRLAGRVPLGESGLYSNGAVELQDESSQLAAMLAAPASGEAVLDACAGAGGKSLAMAMLMGEDGRIVAADPDRRKLDELKRRAARAGVAIIETVSTDDLAERDFDIVFIDAPCSGTGTIRRAPDLKWRVDPRSIEASVKIQRELIERYAKLVRRGGRLVFATCSILSCECEGIVEPFLRRREFALEDARGVFEGLGVDCDGIVSDGGYLRTDPASGDWDGFFAARMRRA